MFLGLSMLLMLVVDHDNWNNAYTLLCMYGVMMLFLAGCMARPKHRLDLDKIGPYYTLFMAFVCYAFLTSLGTDFSSGLVSGVTGSLSWRFFVFHAIAFLITVLTVSSVQKVEQLQLVLVISLFGLTVSALYGCYQGYIGVEVVPSQQDLILNAGMPGRVYSFFDNPNNFGEILIMLMPFLLALLLNARGLAGESAGSGGPGGLRGGHRPDLLPHRLDCHGSCHGGIPDPPELAFSASLYRAGAGRAAPPA